MLCARNTLNYALIILTSSSKLTLDRLPMDGDLFYYQYFKKLTRQMYGIFFNTQYPYRK